MLVDLCAQLADLNKVLADTHVQDREEEAMKIADRIVQLEQKILTVPGKTLSDAAVKLQILKMEMQDQMTPVQQGALDDAARIIASESLN